jgi:hypothetical protein
VPVELSSIYFPLRSNAKTLLAGAPAAAVRRRIKVASLLHDTVLEEDGVWQAHAGPDGSNTMWIAEDPSGRNDWQRATARAAAVGKEFSLLARPSDASADTPYQTMVQSEVELSWWATYLPLKRELPKCYDWMEFVHVPDHPTISSLSRSWTWEDEKDAHLQSEIPTSFVRRLIVNGANHDLATSAALRAAVSMDAYHRKVIRARVARGAAEPVLGHRSLSVAIPRADELPWDDIDDLRKHRDIRFLRDVLRDIEEIAWKSSRSTPAADQEIRREYGRRLADASTRVSGSFTQRVVVGVIGLAAGSFLGPLVALDPMLASTLGSALGVGLDQAQAFISRPRWLVADQAIRNRVEQRRAGEVATRPG